MNTFQYLCVTIQMPTMKEMVQKKRAKILVLVVLLFLAIYISKADVPHINYFSSKNVSYCIGGHDSRTSAIGWIFPDNYDVAIVSKFYPQINSSYNTNFQMELRAEWNVHNWFLSEWDSVSLILDTRWEDIDIVTSNDEFKHTSDSTIHIKKFPISFSVLGDSVEILLCEGWNPEEFPSYMIVLGGVDRNTVLFGYVEKFNSKMDYNKLQTTFTSDNFIVSKDSWKSFHLLYDQEAGTLELQTIIDEKQVSIIKIENIQLKIKPMYFLTRSKLKPAKWKFEDRRFLYTNMTGEAIFGPELPTSSEEICVSLYVSLCKFCAIDFYFYSNGSIVYLKKGISGDHDSKEKEWKEVRLLKFDNLQDSIQIHVNTSFTDPKYNNKTGFWAVDEIRVCTEDEIKISSIESKNSNLFMDSVTCQSLKHPRWRPKREKLPTKPKGKSLQITKVTPTSITFKRGLSLMTNVYSYNYKSVGAKQCNIRYKDPIRQKSNGFLVVSGNEVVFNNLIPYTYYDIMVSDAIYKISETYRVLTSEAQTTYDFEFPENLSIKTTDSSILITWDRLNCTSKRGEVIYHVNILEEGVLVKSFLQDSNRYDIKGLKSFTNYTIEIITARNKDQHPDNSIKRVYHAETLPGVAAAVRNAEFFSVEDTVLRLRYDLPKRPNGVPVEVRSKTCGPLQSNCLVVTAGLHNCTLWPEKYCIVIDSLVSYKNYYVYIALRNNNTKNFGEAVMINAVTKLAAPSPPSNLNYSVVVNSTEDVLCHINITWDHPYLQKSAIRHFDIMINTPSVQDDYESIKEMYIVDKYLPTYSKIIRYIEFSTKYNISVRSVNVKASSEYTSIIITTDHLGKYIDQSPKLLEITPSSIKFTIPILDQRLSSYLLISIIQDDDKTIKPSENLQKMADDDLCQDYGDTWVATVTEVSDFENYNITIGDSTPSNSSLLNKSVHNKPLSPENNYCVTFVIVNRHVDKEHVVVYHVNSITTSSEEKVDYVKSSSSSTMLAIFGALFTVVGCVMAIWAARRYWRRHRMNRNVSNNDPIYMSLESLPQAVSNDTYDKLLLD